MKALRLIDLPFSYKISFFSPINKYENVTSHRFTFFSQRIVLRIKMRTFCVLNRRLFRY
jgi:hypothetical protein